MSEMQILLWNVLFPSLHSQLFGHLSHLPLPVYMGLLENDWLPTSWAIKSSRSSWSKTYIKSPVHFHNVSCVLISLSSLQFGLPRAEKELFEREERVEVQQEILKKVARNLPVYTRTAGGGEPGVSVFSTSAPPGKTVTCAVATVAPDKGGRAQSLPVCYLRAQQPNEQYK